MSGLSPNAAIGHTVLYFTFRIICALAALSAPFVVTPLARFTMLKLLRCRTGRLRKINPGHACG